MSVKEVDYFNMTLIDETLSNFKAFNPKRVYGNNVVRFAGDDGSVASSTGGKSKYSSRFQVSEGNDYDPTSVQNAAPRRNAWASGPPLEHYFDADLSDDEDFPPLIVVSIHHIRRKILRLWRWQFCQRQEWEKIGDEDGFLHGGSLDRCSWKGRWRDGSQTCYY